MYGSWDTEWDRHNFLSFWVIFCPFTNPQPKKQNFEKKRKKLSGDNILLYIHVHHKWRSYDIKFLKYKVQQTEIFSILGHFLPFHLLDNLENQNFKIEKNTWRYYHFPHLHHKWQSYDVWFLRYGAWQKKKHWKILSFYKCVHKWQSYDIWFQRYRVQQTEFLCHFGPTFALLPH